MGIWLDDEVKGIMRREAVDQEQKDLLQGICFLMVVGVLLVWGVWKAFSYFIHYQPTPSTIAPPAVNESPVETPPPAPTTPPVTLDSVKHYRT